MKGIHLFDGQNIMLHGYRIVSVFESMFCLCLPVFLFEFQRIVEIIFIHN